MKRGISLLLIVLLISLNIASALNLNDFLSEIKNLRSITTKAINENTNEKSLIESCKFPSTGTEVVLQKTQYGEVLIWLYEPNKERFGQLTFLSKTAINNKNEYDFKVDEIAYTVKTEIPDHCIRFEDEERAKTERVCATDPIIPRWSVINIENAPERDGQFLICEYQNVPPEFADQPYGNYGPANSDLRTCPTQYCKDFPVEEQTTTPETTSPTRETSSFTSEQQRNIAKGLSVIFERIIKFFIDLIKGIIKFFSDIINRINNLKPQEPKEPEEDKCTGRDISIYNNNKLSEDKFIKQCVEFNNEEMCDYCNDNKNAIIEVFCPNPTENTITTLCQNGCEDGACKECDIGGVFNGKLHRNINIKADIKGWKDTNTDAKVDYELNIEVDKNNNKELCGIPKRVTYLIRTEGAAFHKGVWPFTSYVNIAETLRNSALNVVRKNSPALYKLLKLGIIGKGGIIIDVQGTGTRPKFIGIDKQKTLWNFLRITEKEPGGWLKFEMEATFILNTDNTITATIKEKVIKDSKVIYETTPTKREGITIKEYKEVYINDMIKTIDSIENLKENFDQITNRGNKKTLKRTVHKGVDAKKWVEEENLREGDEIPYDPKINSVTITIEEELNNQQLKEYQDKTK